MNIRERANTLWTSIKKSPVESGVILMMAFLLSYGLVPSSANATVRMLDFPVTDRVTALRIEAMQNQMRSFGSLPAADLRGPSYTMRVPATAYNSDPRQTDNTPFITASGTHVRHGVIAANFLPIGTYVKIPDIYGDQIFVVEDRMNARYDKRVDIWMENYSDAIQFGIRTITIEVYR